MAKFLLLVLSLMLVCISLLPAASAGPKRVARTRQAQEEFRRLGDRQRQLSDRKRQLINVRRGSRPLRHTFDTKPIYDQWRAQGSGSSTTIEYGGGPVLDGKTLKIYLIYYGYWQDGYGQTEVENFIRSLSSADSSTKAQGEAGDQTVRDWWAITSSYYSNTSTVSPIVNLAKVVYDKGSRGTKFSDNTAWDVVSNKVGPGKAFPYDANGIYLILTSKDVTIPGFCKEWCGWHTMDYLKSKRVVYSLVGHHAQCPKSCDAQVFSPNANPAIDAMISTIAHEIAEAATNPDVKSGWFDAEDEENADKCSYYYGDTTLTTNIKGNSAYYNLVGFNGMKFLVQQNWDWATDSCVSQAVSSL
ncbi:hypothetical protein CLOP_g15529 [Closterium sp. NIES-67]|nr:hypothetical protein CLOP_g12551 [Closterium sp. NIES-67]GJP80756.1 hypothetical protein CLOP_g10958 [Closterium sp. NIES-67]GJP85418.1 hypothetical protein CLOP_g15529 [Closterium sp. NIES-67]